MTPINRQQRRAAARSKAPAPQSIPMVYRQLNPPEPVGELKVAEATEMKALNKLVDRAAEDAQHAARMHAAAQGHLTSFIRELVTSRGFDIKTGNYSVDPDSGQILKTGEMAQTEPAPLEVVGADEEPEPDKE